MEKFCILVKITCPVLLRNINFCLVEDIPWVITGHKPLAVTGCSGYSKNLVS